VTLLWIMTGVALVASLAASRRRTWLALKRAATMIWGVLPLLLGVLAVVSLLLAAVPPSAISKLLGGDGITGFIIALVVGSIALIPGFVAFPLAAVLRDNGASIPVLAAFVTSLLMVGVVTLPLEIRFFGRRIALLRNALALAGSVIVALGMTLILRW
jgi:uncharacterized membrane protein YraQ (UPF0718 family)